MSKPDPRLAPFTTLELANELLARIGPVPPGDPTLDRAQTLLARLEYRADYLEAKTKRKGPIGFDPKWSEPMPFHSKPEGIS